MTGKFYGFFEKRKVLKIISMVVGGIFIAALLSFLVGWLVMLLWNWLMPAIFGLGTITYWQGFGIFFFAKLIFGFGGGHDNNEGKGKTKISHKVSKKVGKKFRKEVEKEFEKEFTQAYDEKYENWWNDEGKAAFDEYLIKGKKSDNITNK